MRLYFALIAVLYSLSQCTGGTAGSNEAVKVGDSAYLRELDAERKQKDRDFAANPKSPFAMLTVDFEGLKYYPPDVSWNVEVDWVIADTTFTVEVPDTKGGLRKYTYAGSLSFERNGKHHRLTIWNGESDNGMKFIMFKDRTSGKETYGGGRYIEVPGELLATTHKLDFNRAFNPYCHYNPDYSCPVVPQNCYLDLEITAGEKKYSN